MKKKLFVAIALTMGGSLFVGGAAMGGICASVGLPAGCIDNVDLADKAVSGRTIKGRTINHFKLFLDNIPAANLAPNSVGASELAANSVYSGDIVNGQVTSADIADNSITAADIATNAVGAAEIGEDAVGNSELIEDITLGDTANSGSLVVQGSSGASMLEVYNDVVIGESGATGWDADLEVRDPFYTASTAMNALFFNASLANLYLGSGTATSAGDDGNLYLTNQFGVATIAMDGSSGDVQNNLITGNGLVKAWARINSDGTVASCWRCNTSATYTYRASTGNYNVDFTVDTNISARPKSIVVSNSAQATASYYDTGDTSQVRVVIRNLLDPNNASYDRDFDIIVY